MIDSNPPDPQAGDSGSVPPSDGSGSAPPSQPTGPVSDLYADLFDETPESRTSVPEASPPPVPTNVHLRSQSSASQTSTGQSSAAPAPLSPTSLEQSGLGIMQVCELVLKQLYLQGNLRGVEIARNARLPFQVIDEGLKFLKDEKCIEVASGDLIGPASYRFNLTELGRRRGREAIEQCRYVGPAPVPLEAYVEQCRLQSVAGTDCDRESLHEAFGEMIIGPELLEELGPAVCSGKSIFVYGPPGNGKTMVAKGLGNFLNANGGDVYVPYAVVAENSIVTIFDPTIHETTDDADVFASSTPATNEDMAVEALRAAREQPALDLRWRRVRRPVVITGGELTLEMLDLKFNEVSNFYTAPLHIKANSGVFLIDDFGRQIVSPRDLLNRWILPLEEHVDFLTLATGKKFSVPFEQLIIFSTNLDPRELVDEAFLRRIRHKVKIDSPSRELYTRIFQLCCEQREIEFSASAVEFLYSQYYNDRKLPRSSDPRDLLEITKSICRFRNQQVLLEPGIVAEAAERFFCQV